MIFGKLANLLESNDGAPPAVVWIFVAIWLFLMVGLPIILAITSLRQKRLKAQAAAEEARRNALSGEIEKPALKEQKIEEEREQKREALLSSLSRINPELQQRLEDKKRQKELRQTRDTMHATIDTSKYCIGVLEGDEDSPLKIEIQEEKELVQMHIDILPEDELAPEDAARLMILGDILNNPKVPRLKK